MKQETSNLVNFSKALRKRNCAGFTMIEMVVSMAIFITITSIIMVSQRRFGSNILITNLAYDVALSIRQAQVYGISVKRATQVTSSQFTTGGYGIYFALTGAFVLFADLDSNGMYDERSSNLSGCLAFDTTLNPNPECVSVYKIQQGNSISKFCGGSDCAGREADGTSTNGNIDNISIIFKRPNPEPLIRASKDDVLKPEYTTASVTVSSPQGLSRTVNVSAGGQISVQ